MQGIKFFPMLLSFFNPPNQSVEIISPETHREFEQNLGPFRNEPRWYDLASMPKFRPILVKGSGPNGETEIQTQFGTGFDHFYWTYLPDDFEPKHWREIDWMLHPNG